MNALAEQLKAVRTWWDGLTAREHVMLGALAVVAALVLGWFLIVSPLLAWRAGAGERLAEAVRTHAVASAATGLEAAGGAVRPAAEVERLLTDAAADAGLSVQIGRDGAGVTFAVESAETARLFGWIAALEQTSVRIAGLSVLENADATLQAQGTVAAGGPA